MLPWQQSYEGFLYFRSHYGRLYVHLFTGFLGWFKLFIKDALGDKSQGAALGRTSSGEHVQEGIESPCLRVLRGEVVLTAVLPAARTHSHSLLKVGSYSP